MKTEEEGTLPILMVLLLACKPVHSGVTSKHSLLLIRLSSPKARAPQAVPLTTPLNINTMEPSLWPLRYASARQCTFISAYTLHTHGQLIYLPCLRIKGWSGWWWWGVCKHALPLCSGLCIWVGDGEHLAQVASSRLCILPRGLFMKEAETCLAQTHRPNPALIWLSPGSSRRAASSAQRLHEKASPQ